MKLLPYLPILQQSVAAALDGNLVTRIHFNLCFCFGSSQTNRQIRLNELLKEHSSTANLIVMQVDLRAFLFCVVCVAQKY